MKDMVRWAVCSVVILTMACGGGDGGGGITPPPPPTDVCPNIDGVQTSVPTGMVKDASGNCVTPPPNNTRDSLTAVLAPADSLDLAPTGAFVDFISTDSVSVAYTSWYTASSVLSVPKGVSGRLCVRGGEKYESRCWNITASSGARFASVLHPKCWMIRGGSFSGTSRCLSSTDLKTAPGSDDPWNFYFQWATGSLVPWGWPEDQLPAKVILVDPSPAGSWSSARRDSVVAYVDSVNKACVRWPNCSPLLTAVAATTTDSVPSTGFITVLQRPDSGQSVGGPILNSSNGDISRGKISLSSTGLVSLPHELLHVMGFGHTCRWMTFMGTKVCPEKFSTSNWFTADDIAGFQLAYAIRAQSKRINANLSWF